MYIIHKYLNKMIKKCYSQNLRGRLYHLSFRDIQEDLEAVYKNHVYTVV